MQGTSFTSLDYFPRYQQTAVSSHKANDTSASALELRTVFYVQERIVSTEELLSKENQR